MIEQIFDNLYRLEIPLPKSPLKSLNSYIMKSKTRNIIVDTGFNMPECLEAMLDGIKELGLDMNITDIVATHLHSDHIGLIPQIISENSKVYMGEIDRDVLLKFMKNGDKYWNIAENRFIDEGYPKAEMDKTRLSNPGRKFAPKSLFDIIPLNDEDKIICGNLNWEVIFTPGHTPGHISLYEPLHKILIAGDLILFDITPNIAWWNELDNSLDSYLISLKKIAKLDVKTTLTGHRSNEGSFINRIKELEDHHELRLKDILKIVSNKPNISGYEIASNMSWSIRGTWEDFPPGQRWFAVGEAITHIEYLMAQGKLKMQVTDGVNTYTL